MSERCPICNSPDPKLHPAVQHEGEVSICGDQFHVLVPDEKYRTRAPIIAEQEICRRTGQEEALKYVDGWITSHMSKDNANTAYIAGLEEIRINVQAALERIGKGEPMQATSECCGISLEEWYEGFSPVART